MIQGRTGGVFLQWGRGLEGCLRGLLGSWLYFLIWWHMGLFGENLLSYTLRIWVLFGMYIIIQYNIYLKKRSKVVM